MTELRDVFAVRRGCANDSFRKQQVIKYGRFCKRDGGFFT